jgi:hypothetical protein
MSQYLSVESDSMALALSGALHITEYVCLSLHELSTFTEECT